VKWLGERYGVGSRYPWIGVGHSCGATLLAQLVAGTGVENQVGEGAVGPQSLVLMAGIYDLRAMLENHQPPVCPLHIAKIYEEFVQGAFGTDTKGHYTAVSPSSGTYTVETCPRLKEIVLAYSASDELIEPQQRAIMAARLKDCGWVERGQAGERIVEMKDLTQGHDEVWQDGQQVAGLIGEAVGRMFGAI
jgi:kynurenine formamidase